MSYDALHGKKSLSVWFMAIREVMYGNSHAHIKSDVLLATTVRKLKYRKKPVLVAPHATGCLCSI